MLAVGSSKLIKGGLRTLEPRVGEHKFANVQFHNTSREYEYSVKKGSGHMDIVDAVAVSESAIIAMAGGPTEFFYIEVHRQEGEQKAPYSKISHIVGGGYGNRGISLTLLPNFSSERYPLILVKEDTVMSVWEYHNNSFMNEIVKYPAVPDSRDSEVFFDTDQSFTTVVPWLSGQQTVNYELVRVNLDLAKINQSLRSSGFH